MNIETKKSKGVPMIQLENINKYYGDFHVTKNLSLTVKDGEIYGLIGKNGSGKTTLFKVILGLSDFQSGSLNINGKSNKSGLMAERKKIGFFIGKNFFNSMNAADNLHYYRKLKGITDKREVDRVLKIVNLDKTNAKFKSFSMGMKQRLGIANALLGNPQMLIFDEPTNGLDPQGIADVRNLIKKLNREYGMTIIVSSHILGELEHTANRFGIIHNGKVLKEISTEDLQVQSDIVQIKVSNLNEAKKALYQNSVEILGIKSEKKELEDYYFELVGGEQND